MEVIDEADRANRDEHLRQCDVVMKGGITSGVVYPLAAVELSKHYTFKNVGGSSAGAIAAACVAAAEHGRKHGRGRGFGGLAELPEWLGAHLSELLQAEPETRPLFRLVLAGTMENKAKALGAALLRGFAAPLLLGALPGLVLVALAVLLDFGGWSIALGALMAVVGGLAGIAAGLLRQIVRTIPANGFGLCSGGGATRPGATPPLSAWLARLIDDLAGQEGERPLTFGDLWGATAAEAERDVNLEMMTTCLTLGRPFRLPFDTSDFFFEPEHFRRLFPAHVVEHMLRCARRPRDDERNAPAHLERMPAAAELPVVVGVRMSLSFPLLISAVPLWTVDQTRKFENGEPELCWFSDGGITSNFPVHFFDGPLPAWPTFAINLRPFHPDFPPSETDECENVWMPSTNQETLDFWSRWEDEPARGQIFAFLASIFRTAQNWMDNTQSQAAGYRDRVAHIKHTEKEGGINLSMPSHVIERLSVRGQCAGARLWRRFGEGDGTELTWDNHRWVRYRSLMSALEPYAERFVKRYREPQPGDRSIESLVASEDPPPSYPWEDATLREWAEQQTREFVDATADWEAAVRSFETGAPEPVPQVRVVPRV